MIGVDPDAQTRNKMGYSSVGALIADDISFKRAIMPKESDDFAGKQAAVFLAHLQPDGRYHLLRDHLLSVSEAAERMSGKIGIGAAGTVIGLMHDLGKYSGDFQCYLRGIKPDQDTEQQ